MKIFTMSMMLGLFCFTHLFGQLDSASRVTIDVKNSSFNNFVHLLEAQTGLYFYYDPASTDSLRISISVVSQPISSVLKQAVTNTLFSFAFDDEKHVFVTSGHRIQFSKTGDNAKWQEIPKLVLASNRKYDTDVTAIEKATLENKLYEIGIRNNNSQQDRATIAGYVNDAKTGEPVVGASIVADKLDIGTTTDEYGYFILSLPRGRHVLNIQSLGMKDTRRQIALNDNGKINIELNTTVLALRNVTISAQKLSNVRGPQMGLQKIDIKAIKQVPVVFGEADILRVVTTLPGVKTVGEASTGLNVRGGAADQNLILFNDATLYNPAHFFGMFSALNPEVVKDVELYKSSIPVRYGGRLSSVLNINGRDGNKKTLAGSAGIGLLTGRLQIEGPLIKDKSSFIIGGRTTYANWLLNLLPDQYKNSKASFYDINLNLNHEFDKKNTLYVTGYLSSDRFNLNSDTLFGYSNKNISLKWKHTFSNKLSATLTTGYDGYEYYTSSETLPLSAYELKFGINQTYLRSHFTYYADNKHTVEFGVNALLYKIHPGSYQPIGSQSLVRPEVVSEEQALESALYLSDRYNVTKALSVDAGLRYSMFNFLGPKDVAVYAPGQPRTASNSIGTTKYASGKFIKTYGGPEVRLSLRYAFNDSFSIKAGYSTQRQYIHSISNTASMSPTDIWKLSDPNIKPQFGAQYSLGLYKNFKSNTIEASVEVYYKNISNYLDYKSGARLTMNQNIETDVLNTRGKAYGVEVLLKKATGKLNGWISYTYSRILLKMDDPVAGELINKGLYYPANYDMPHNATLVGNYRFNHRFSLSFNTVYSTGRPITLPVAVFYFAGSQRTLYADRNAYRIPDYFRSDLSMNIDGNHKVKQLIHTSVTVGVYNITGRKNPYSVYYVSEGGFINGYKLSIFGSAIPYVNFNIKF